MSSQLLGSSHCSVCIEMCRWVAVGPARSIAAWFLPQSWEQNSILPAASDSQKTEGSAKPLAESESVTQKLQQDKPIAMDVLSAKSASSPMLRDDHKSRDYSQCDLSKPVPSFSWGWSTALQARRLMSGLLHSATLGTANKHY